MPRGCEHVRKLFPGRGRALALTTDTTVMRAESSRAHGEISFQGTWHFGTTVPWSTPLGLCPCTKGAISSEGSIGPSCHEPLGNHSPPVASMELQFSRAEGGGRTAHGRSVRLIESYARSPTVDAANWGSWSWSWSVSRFRRGHPSNSAYKYTPWMPPDSSESCAQFCGDLDAERGTIKVATSSTFPLSYGVSRTYRLQDFTTTD